MGEHRVAMLGGSLRRYVDPERSADPRVRSIITQLRSVELAPAPEPHFRAELRAQLVAVAPRIIAEGEQTIARAATHPVRLPARAHAPARAAGSRPAVMPPPAAAFGGRFGTISVARPMAIATASLAVLALLLAGAVLMSRQALPGDALYGLKRADENVQLSLAGSDTAKGQQYLKQATNRADEVAALLKRASALAVGSGPSVAGNISAHTAALISGALNSGDADVRDATRLLGTEAVEQGSSSPLTPLTSWAPEQRARLQQIAAELPDGLLHARAVESSDLVTSALTRAQTLSSLAACHCLSTTTSDSLGPVPCGPCDGVAATPTVDPANPAPTVAAPGAGAPGGSAPGTGSPQLAPATGSGGSSSGGSSSGGGSTTANPRLPLPTLPKLPTLSVPSLPPLLPPATSTRTSAPSTRRSCALNLLGLCI